MIGNEVQFCSLYIKNKRSCRVILTAFLCQHSDHQPMPRSIWSKPRSTHWWESVRAGIYGEGWWKENLRMSKHTFTIICTLLRPYIEKENTHMRAAIGVDKRVVITLWKLATNIEYRTLSALFGIGRSTVGEIVIETCQAIAKLLPRYVKIPRGDSLNEIVKGFEEYWGFPQAAGAIDGSHIPIIKPKESAADYYNRKGYYSIIVQALVDFRGRFLDVYMGWPGKVHDARVFVNSSLYQKGINGCLFPDMKKNINGVDVPLVILGDPAYPALPWLMKPFPENEHTTTNQKLFNYRQSRARMVVENSFGRLKGRWRCLLKRLDCDLNNVCDIVASCIVLHNICEMYGDTCSEEWTYQDDPSTWSLPSSSHTSSTASRSDASIVRDAIMNYFST